MDKIKGCGIIIVLLLTSLSLAGASASDKASFEVLDSSKSANGAAYAYAISADGSTIVGDSGTGKGARAFLLRNGSMTELGQFDSEVKLIESFATSVSANGLIHR